MKILTIISGGPGGPMGLTVEAEEAIRRAARVYTVPRLAEAYRKLNPGIAAMAFGEIQTALERDDREDAAVIVSGDAGFHSLAGPLTREMGGRYQIRWIPGVGALQAICARLHTDYNQAVLASSHNRPLSLVGAVSYNTKVFTLTAGPQDATRILAELRDAGLGEVEAAAGENLGLPGERVLKGPARVLAETAFDGLIALLIENPAAVDRHGRLRDSDFIRGGTPMTKESARLLALARLEVAPRDVVWDIGAGTGAMSAALARAAWDGAVYAVERDSEALALLEANRQKLGGYNIRVVEGAAPQALAELPVPDKVFIGGSGGHMEEILDNVLYRCSRVTVCVNTVTLESGAGAVRMLEERGFRDVEAACINVSHAGKAGIYHLMRAENPVTIISGRWDQSV